jgi:uncharacterized protein (TIGR02001 family)
MKNLLLKVALLPLTLPLCLLTCSTYAFSENLGADDAPAISVTVSTDYVSEYVFRDVTLAGSAFQPGAEISVGNFTAGVWASLASGEESAAFANEIDFYAGYAFPLSDIVSADVGATLYHYPQSGGIFDIGSNDASTLEFYGGLSFDVPLAPAVTAFYDVNLEAFTVEAGVSHSYPLGPKTSFDLSGAAGLVSVNSGTDYQYGSLSASVAYSFTNTTSAYIGVNGGVSSEDTFADIKFDISNPASISAPDSSSVWFGIGISSGF